MSASGRTRRPRKRSWLPALLASALLVSVLIGAGACSEGGAAGDPGERAAGEGEQATAVAAEPEETTEATVGVAARAEEDEAAGGGAGGSGAGAVTAAATMGFVADTEDEGGSGYGADGVLAVRYGMHEGYERLVVDLGSGGKPAGSVPRWSLMSPEGDGLTRISLPSVSETRVSDGRLGSGLLKTFYVVRAPEGGMFVDVFARKAFTYRVMELTDPARLVVDFRTGGRPLGTPLPKRKANTVLVEPRRGADVADPLTVSGYSRNFEASNTIVLKDADGDTLARRNARSNDWSSTWGYFEATLEVPSFEGRGTLRVGTRSARDGRFEGVEIPVRGRQP